MQGTQGKTKRENAKQRSSSCFLQKLPRNKIRIQVHPCRQKKGNSPGKKHSKKQCISRFFFFFKGRKGGAQPGNGSLDSHSRCSQDDPVNGKGKLVNSNSLCTNSMRKEYSIEETHDPAGKASKGKDQGSPEKKLIRHDDQTTIFLDNLCPNVP